MFWKNKQKPHPMPAYYNEFKPEAAHMLRQLIRDGLIAAGDVDERSITEVKPDDLKSYTQCHFFAGIGGWSVALRLAMWADDRPVWTGSCPCQPFSSAGKQKGKDDERHLWPVWFRLIRECRPAIVFGEQVAAAIAHGWWDDVADDLESEGYACGAAVLPACSVGKPHKRDRLWFVANAPQPRTSNDYGRLRQRLEGIDGGENSKTSYVGNARQQPSGNESLGFGGEWQHSDTAGFGAETGHRFADTGSLGNTRLQRQAVGEQQTAGFEQSGEGIAVGNSELHGCDGSSQRESLGTGENQGRVLQSERPSASELVANTECKGLERHGGYDRNYGAEGWQEQDGYAREADLHWLICPDGKTRPVKRGISLLAHGIQHRTPILHAFGNAIVPQVAAEFIKAVSEDSVPNKAYLETI